jgi:quercetin 2,3-dioxygenase
MFWKERSNTKIALVTGGHSSRRSAQLTAGRGITHSEFNPSRTELVHFLQIWIMPEQPDISPSYEQEAIDLSAARGKFHPIASRQGGPGKVKLHQDATMSLAILEPGEKLLHRLASGRRAWRQVARGAIALNDYALTAGDGVAIDAERELTLEANRTAEILIFDLA